MLQESQVKRSKYQNNSYIHDQPFPEQVSEEQDTTPITTATTRTTTIATTYEEFTVISVDSLVSGLYFILPL
jgi:hypothetical protein